MRMIELLKCLVFVFFSPSLLPSECVLVCLLLPFVNE